jgi:ATP-dependent DNA helicase PIF1
LGAKAANKKQAENLLAELYYSLGSRVMLSVNLWTDNGLVNGSLGTIRDIVWEEGKDPSKHLPLTITAEFGSYNGPFFEDTRTVPIFSATTRFEYKNHDCERTQLPLVVAYAISIHKSRGMTLTKAVLNIENKDLGQGSRTWEYIEDYELGRAIV